MNEINEEIARLEAEWESVDFKNNPTSMNYGKAREILGQLKGLRFAIKALRVHPYHEDEDVS